MRLVPVLCVSLIAPALSAFGQSIPTFPSANYNDRAPEGIFDVLVYVDHEAFLYVRGTEVTYLSLNTVPVRNAGTNYTQPIPVAVFGSFNMRKVAGRGVVDLVEPPGPGNNYTAILRVTDRNAGEGFYHIQLTWHWDPANPSRSPNARSVPSRPSIPATPSVSFPFPFPFPFPLPSPAPPSPPPRSDPRGNSSRNGTFEFSGAVDGVVVLHIRGNQVRTQVISGRSLTQSSFKFSQPLPAVQLRSVTLTNVSGRGQVELLEIPWQGNQYTAVVRISDRMNGAGRYSFRLRWQR